MGEARCLLVGEWVGGWSGEVGLWARLFWGGSGAVPDDQWPLPAASPRARAGGGSDGGPHALWGKWVGGWVGWLCVV